MSKFRGVSRVAEPEPGVRGNRTRNTKLDLLTPSLPTVEPLSFRPPEAARALGVSERLLWTWTQEQRVPHVRIGNVVLYPVDELRGWLRGNTRALAGGEQNGTEEHSTADNAEG